MAIADIKTVDVKFRIELQIQEREHRGLSAEANILEEGDWTNALADLKEVFRLPPPLRVEQTETVRYFCPLVVSIAAGDLAR